MTQTAAPGADLDAGTTARWVLALTQFLLILDTALLNVAAPVIGSDLGMSDAGQTWVLNAYVVAFGGLLLLSGCLADVVGQGRALMAGLCVLAGAAAVGAVAESGALVIASRAGQGAGAGLAAAAAMALVFSRFGGAARDRTLGLFAAMAGLGGAVGTVLGGVLSDWVSWRATFWLNVVAAVVLVVLARREPAFRGDGVRRRFNAVGGVCLTAGLAATAYALTAGGETGWTALPVLVALGVAVAGFAAYALTERASRVPLVARTTWRNGRLLFALALASVGQLVLVPCLYVISVYLQEVRDLPPAQAGLGLLPMSVLIIVLAPMVPGLIGRWGLRAVTAGAFALVGLSMLWLARLGPDSSYLGAVLGPTLLIAFALPTVAITTNIAAAMAAPPDQPGLSSGLLTTAQQFGATLGLAGWLSIAVAAGGQTRGYSAAFLIAAGVAGAAALAVGVVRAERPKSGI
ncbi:MFS transporter [Nocardioides speluncae]|uniref:MFS transporter n=1 Tax=Nocardioides speluncae TaxID=2670337 RepID=UPI00137A0D8D|nr:MFS transporter [Nocardioides speluncae]